MKIRSAMQAGQTAGYYYTKSRYYYSSYSKKRYVTRYKCDSYSGCRYWYSYSYYAG